MQVETKIQGTPYVPKNSLDKSKMRHPWSMHMKTDLLNSIGDIWTRQSKILKSTSQVSILSSIRNKITLGG
jgi:hypothetical protein